MTIPNQMIFLPLLLQILLTIAIYVALAVAKSRALKSGQVDLARRALHADAWPESVQKINNNIRNQFEVPVLFYILVLVLHQLGAAGVVAQTLAWLFVASRILHAVVHTRSNHVPVRRPVFMFGCLIVLALGVLAAAAVFGQRGDPVSARIAGPALGAWMPIDPVFAHHGLRRRRDGLPQL